MLRSGFTESAKQLAAEKGIEDLADLNVFVQCQKIAESLRKGETKEALQWCAENKVALKKSQVCFLPVLLLGGLVPACGHFVVWNGAHIHIA